MILTYILSRTVFQLFHSSGHIIVFDKEGGGVTLVYELVLGDLCEYRHKSYTVFLTTFLELHLCSMQYGSVFNNLT